MSNQYPQPIAEETEPMMFKIESKMKKQLYEVGEKEERTLAWLIRKSIRYYLEEKYGIKA